MRNCEGEERFWVEGERLVWGEEIIGEGMKNYYLSHVRYLVGCYSSMYVEYIIHQPVNHFSKKKLIKL